MDRERKAFEAFARGLVPEGVTVRQVTWDGAGIPRLCFVWPDGDRRDWLLQKEWGAWRARAALSRAPGEATEAGQAEIRVLRSPDRHDEPASVYVLPGSTEASQPSPWYVCVQVFPDALSVIYFVRRGGVMIDREIPLSELRASVDAAPAEPTEAMVEAGARAIYDASYGSGAWPPANDWVADVYRRKARACYAAMRAESEGGGVVAGTGDRMEREACAGDSASAGPGPIGAAPPSPGSDLLREVEAFLRAIGESPALLDTKDAATARELAGDLRALIEGCPHA